MASRLRHRPSTSTAPPVLNAPSVNPELALASVQQRPRERTLAGHQLPEQERPFVVPVGKQWEIHPYVESRKVPTVQGALLKLFYPDMIGPRSNTRVAKSWKDYKWTPCDGTLSAAEIIKREFWLRFRCAAEVDPQHADSIFDINMTNLVRHMMCDLKKDAFNKVYQKESFEEEEDEEGNLWPKAKELMDVKPEDFATQTAWNALCLYWSTPSFRKNSLRGKNNRLAGDHLVYHCNGSRSLTATRQFLRIRDGVDPVQVGAWHYQHRMQQGTNKRLCSKKAADIWIRYDTAMTEKSGENWQDEHTDIDHEIVHNIAGAPHGTFAMGDGVICPSDDQSIKSRKRTQEESLASGVASGASGTQKMLIIWNRTQFGVLELRELCRHLLRRLTWT